MAEAVVSGALLAVLQDVIGLVDLFEAAFGVLVPLVAVGVELHGQLAVGLFDIVVRGVPPDAQDFVKIALGHGGRFLSVRARGDDGPCRRRRRRRAPDRQAPGSSPEPGATPL